MLNRYQTLCLLYTCFGATFYGYDTSMLREKTPGLQYPGALFHASTLIPSIGITASVLAYPQFIKYFALTSDTIGAINSAYQAASAFGALLNIYLPNRVGSKSCYRLDNVISRAIDSI